MIRNTLERSNCLGMVFLGCLVSRGVIWNEWHPWMCYDHFQCVMICLQCAMIISNVLWEVSNVLWPFPMCYERSPMCYDHFQCVMIISNVLWDVPNVLEWLFFMLEWMFPMLEWMFPMLEWMFLMLEWMFHPSHQWFNSARDDSILAVVAQRSPHTAISSS